MPYNPIPCCVPSGRYNRGIGDNGSLPRPFLLEDMKHFGRVTKSKVLTKCQAQTSADSLLFNSPLRASLKEPVQQQETINAVVMGRKTWDSIPQDKKPLKKRLSVVISSKPDELREQMAQ